MSSTVSISNGRPIGPRSMRAVRRRRGSMLVYTGVAMTLMLGLVTLSIDWGRVQLAKTQLQQAADGAARYAAAALPSGVAAVQARAAAAVAENQVDGAALTFNSASDVEFGVWDQATRNFVVLSGNNRNSATAVRVTAARNPSRGSAFPLIFGAAIGRPTINLSASSIVARGQPSSVAIEADSCPWLAGMPNNSTVAATGGNTTPSRAPANSPPQVQGIPLVPGQSLVFRQASGQTSYDGAGDYGPDGNTDWIVAQDAVNGINTTKAPLNSLVGIFLDDRAPNTYSQAAAGDFSTDAKRNFSTLSPPLKQVFFIGDGLNNAGKLQEFVVPAGATRLYLGIMDEKGWWWDNTGVLSTTLMNDKITLVK